MKNKKNNWTAKLLNKFKHLHQPNMVWFFSDKKTFSQDQMRNSQNNRCLALSPQDALILMKTLSIVHIMVFVVVTSDVDVMRPSQTQHRGLHQVPGRGSASLGGENSCRKTLCLTTVFYAIPHKQEGTALSVRKFL